ncbi:MAG: L-serine ammonia-lyase, iron-sulfur-dependent subunit beta [Acidaminococcaceae bacterium]|nr:L-serine ammonia-lyase, iron-sulfur-dependent subunit beta [Acidaminococcaceae bacterium]MDD4722657.1 L-serine ammonia-lyase, iron-sulfur-dependent subunit beta [Acidaminococcaceae bacterium]
MNLLDVIGPVMIGPSSSHTAGAVRLGLLAVSILGESPIKADIALHGSFAQTYRGHGTDMALLAGLMGWMPDDARIPEADIYAEQKGLQYKFSTINLGELTHPNTVRFHLEGVTGKTCVVTGSSIGGGQVCVTEIDDFPVELNGNLPGVLIVHQDRPGVIALVSGKLSEYKVNIAGMRVFRTNKGGTATMIIECDQMVPEEALKAIREIKNVESVRFINKVL